MVVATYFSVLKHLRVIYGLQWDIMGAVVVEDS